MSIKNKPVLLSVILSFVVFLGGMILNLPEFLFGHGATMKNLVVSCIYILVWISVLIMATKGKSRKTLMYCLIFWILTSMSAIMTLMGNMSDAPGGLGIIFVFLFMGQFYGIVYFADSYIFASLVIIVISLCMLAAAVVLYIVCHRTKLPISDTKPEERTKAAGRTKS